MDKIIEAVREIVRTSIMAVIPLVISALSSGEKVIDWRAIVIALVIAILSGIDNWLHRSEIQPYKSIGIKHEGLVPV